MTASENLGVVRAYTDSWQAGDFPAMFAHYSMGFTLHYGGANRLSGVHRGKSDALQALIAFSEKVKRELVEVVDIMAGATHATIIVRERFQTEPAIDVERIFVYRLADGVMRECWVHDTPEAQAVIDRLIGSSKF